MITLLTGNNYYARRQALAALRANFSGEVELYDGGELTREQLRNVTQGATLFSINRLAIIKDISVNKSLWPELDSLLEHVSDSTHLVLDDPAVDKRTKSYMWLQKHADVRVFEEWTMRDEYKAMQWCEAEAKVRGITISKPLIAKLVQRSGVEQWRVAAALEKLELAGGVTPEIIEQIIEPRLEENVFELFATALSGNKAKVENMLETLAQTDDAYRVFALISSQAVQFATLLVSGKSASEVAGDSKASPYVLSKLAAYTSGRSAADSVKILQVMARADRQMKTTGGDKWGIVASALLSL